jgi:protein arginine kinase
MMGSKRSYRRIAAELPRWLSNEGPEGDVVLSTRLHLSRNCQDFCFPSMMESAEKIEILRRSEEAVREMEGEYRAMELASLDEIKRLLLTEQLYLPGSQADPDEIGPGTRLWLSGDGGSALLLNWEDHIRLSEIAPGFEIAESYRRLEAADSVLERYFSYAVSLELGYLRSRIEKTGSGLRAEVLLHLPGLGRDKRFDEVVAHAQREGLNLSRFGSTGGGSLAEVYLLVLEGQLGIPEQDLLEKLALVVVEFIHYEREARKNQRISGAREYLDLIWRDYGTLSHSRLLNLRESLDLYSRVRCGQSLGILPDGPPGIGLFFLTQPGHVQYFYRQASQEQALDGPKDGSPATDEASEEFEADLEEFRADLFRDAFASKTVLDPTDL